MRRNPNNIYICCLFSKSLTALIDCWFGLCFYCPILMAYPSKRKATALVTSIRVNCNELQSTKIHQNDTKQSRFGHIWRHSSLILRFVIIIDARTCWRRKIFITSVVIHDGHLTTQAIPKYFDTKMSNNTFILAHFDASPHRFDDNRVP